MQSVQGRIKANLCPKQMSTLLPSPPRIFHWYNVKTNTTSGSQDSK